MKKAIIILSRIFSVILLAFYISFLNAQNNNNIINERIVDEFNSIEVNGNVKIIFKQGEEQSLKVEAPSENQSKINTLIKNKALLINVENANTDVIIYITCVKPEKITLNGIASLTTENIISSDNFSINLSSASKIKINLIWKVFIIFIF